MKFPITAQAALAAALVAATAAPAMAADWQRVDTVHVERAPGKDISTPNFGGAVKALRLTAAGANISCKSVTARFANGTTWKIFSGRLNRGVTRTVDVPGNRRQVTRLTFRCTPSDNKGRIIVQADVTGYRTIWLRSTTWKRLWGL